MMRASVLACCLVTGVVGQDGGMRKPDPTVTTLATGKAGYTTYRVSAMFPEALDVYALFGQPGADMIMPPAFQVATPFGANVGE